MGDVHGKKRTEISFESTSQRRRNGKGVIKLKSITKPEARKKILVVDDEKSIRLIIESTFRHDFTVISLSNGEEALALLDDGNVPDLIICDLVMPKMDGFNFTHILRSSGFFDDIPLIILSGSEESQDRIRCFELGADDFLIKPFSPKELLARVRRRLIAREKYMQRSGW
jgi:two-component system, chemotaxis family, chemotaxis protein CheY